MAELRSVPARDARCAQAYDASKISVWRSNSVTRTPGGIGGRMRNRVVRRQRIVALMRDQASPQHVDALGAAGNSFLRNGHQHRGRQFERPGKAA